MTPAQAIAFAPAAGRFAEALAEHLPAYAITTGPRVAAFMAQVAHESGGFRYVRELWGPTTAQQRYEGRADLGNTVAGDGKRYLGRGLIQITGRANYVAASRALYGDLRLVDEPSLLEQPDAAVQSACWFWDSRKLNDYADAGQFETITRRVNGGLNGYSDRVAWHQKAKLIWLMH